MSEISKYLENKLNKQQFKAATWNETSSLILAWAWSGKTRVLTYKIAYLIFKKSINPQNILAVTFTNKAANEMKERLIKIASDFNKIRNKEGLSEWVSNNTNLTNNSLKWVWTFHSIFLKILKEDIEKLDLWYDKNFWIYDSWESISIIKNIIKNNNWGEKITHKEVKSRIWMLKNEWITYSQFLNTVDPKEELIAGIYKKYQKALIESNSLDFDDLLLCIKLLFEKDKIVLKKWEEKFQYILVDEAQDTNQIQFDIIKLLSWKDGNITFIGDDFQSIYGWRWAVMNNFLNISDKWKDIKTFKLEINYRSRPHIVEAWNYIIAHNKKQYNKNVVANRKWDDKIRLFIFNDEIDEAINIVNLIKKFKNEKNKSRSDFVILYRTNAQSQPFEQILITDWVPYKVWWGFKFFERKEIKDIVWYIKYILNPKDNVSLKRIINTPSRKIWQTSIEKIENYSIENNITISQCIDSIDTLPIKMSSSIVNNIKQFNTIIKFLLSQAEGTNPEKLIKSIVSNIKYKDYLIKQEGKEKAEEKMENIWQLINMASKYSSIENKDGIELLRQFFEEVSLMVDASDNETEKKDFVNLMSIHSSKWLEFPNVFITWLEDNIFPLTKAKFDEKEMEEERRLMYVAITRTEDILFLSYANSRQQWGQTRYNAPSKFIDELPDDLLKVYNLWNGGWFIKREESNISEWDIVRHKLFGKWEVMETWNEQAVVQFENPKSGLRKIDMRFLEQID